MISWKPATTLFSEQNVKKTHKPQQHEALNDPEMRKCSCMAPYLPKTICKQMYSFAFSALLIFALG